jgi:hypothetical protein
MISHLLVKKIETGRTVTQVICFATVIRYEAHVVVLSDVLRIFSNEIYQNSLEDPGLYGDERGGTANVVPESRNRGFIFHHGNSKRYIAP